ncbi:uncharacterized protein LOC121817549 [Ovis aries]|uniref:uncharacterized protein LOC121817549 n=1 Tax=Ovis aries TaxID=9940 RepID=UPI001C2E6BF8|nr:uncharacterized protein LOC121817549 [Ovis aries]
MACAVSRRPAWPPWAFCAAFSRPFPHRGGQQLPGLPGGAQRGRRHRHPPPPLWSASLQTGRAPSSGSWGLREVLLAGDSPRLQSSGARPWCWRFPAACGGRPEAGEGEARRRQSPGQDLTGAKLWTEEMPGFLEVAGPQAVMPRVTHRWMDREASKVVQAMQRWRKNTFQVQQVRRRPEGGNVAGSKVSRKGLLGEMGRMRSLGRCGQSWDGCGRFGVACVSAPWPALSARACLLLRPPLPPRRAMLSALHSPGCCQKKPVTGAWWERESWAFLVRWWGAKGFRPCGFPKALMSLSGPL